LRDSIGRGLLKTLLLLGVEGGGVIADYNWLMHYDPAILDEGVEVQYTTGHLSRVFSLLEDFEISVRKRNNIKRTFC
jgi:hypothetical protein